MAIFNSFTVSLPEGKRHLDSTGLNFDSKGIHIHGSQETKIPSIKRGSAALIAADRCEVELRQLDPNKTGLMRLK